MTVHKDQFIEVGDMGNYMVRGVEGQTWDLRNPGGILQPVERQGENGSGEG